MYLCIYVGLIVSNMSKPKFFNKKCFDFDLFSCDKKIKELNIATRRIGDDMR